MTTLITAAKETSARRAEPLLFVLFVFFLCSLLTCVFGVFKFYFARIIFLADFPYRKGLFSPSMVHSANNKLWRATEDRRLKVER